MNYKIKLEELRNMKKDILSDGEVLKKEELEELEQAKKEITEKYRILFSDYYFGLENINSEICDQCKLIEKYSTIDNDILYVITELITIFEGEPYVLEQLCYHKDKSAPASVWETLMIMPKNVFENIKNPNYISERYFHHLLKNGIAMKISEDWSLSSLKGVFSFYKADKTNINPKISFKGFQYVKEFIDYIINYRMQNNIDDLSVENITTLKEEFILLNIKNIENNYKLKQDKKIKETNVKISSEYSHKKDVLNRLVKKISKN